MLRDNRPLRFQPCIATMSLGDHRQHSLDVKLRMAAKAGFKGIELYWDDFIAECRRNDPSSNTEDMEIPLSDAKLGAEAHRLRQLCESLHLTIVSLQPFRDFDGIIDDNARGERLDEFDTWIDLANILGTKLICVPASIEARGRTGQRSALVQDLKYLVYRAAPEGITVGYESLCFSAHVSRWQDAWEVVAEAASQLDDEGLSQTSRGQSSLMILLDTFNIAGQRFPFGCSAGRAAMQAASQLDEVTFVERPLRSFQAENELLAKMVSGDMTVVLQVADADLDYDPACGHPHSRGNEPNKECLKKWARSHRKFPLEGSQDSIQEGILQAITSEKSECFIYERWVSIEVFSKDGEAPGEETVERLAERAARSWWKLFDKMGWGAKRS